MKEIYRKTQHSVLHLVLVVKYRRSIIDDTIVKLYTLPTKPWPLNKTKVLVVHTSKWRLEINSWEFSLKIQINQYPVSDEPRARSIRATGIFIL